MDGVKTPTQKCAAIDEQKSPLPGPRGLWVPVLVKTNRNKSVKQALRLLRAGAQAARGTDDPITQCASCQRTGFASAVTNRCSAIARTTYRTRNQLAEEGISRRWRIHSRL